MVPRHRIVRPGFYSRRIELSPIAIPGKVGVSQTWNNAFPFYSCFSHTWWSPLCHPLFPEDGPFHAHDVVHGPLTATPSSRVALLEDAQSEQSLHVTVC